MKNIKDNVLQEQKDDNLGYELGVQMSSLGPIPKAKKQAAEVIKRIFNSSNQEFYKPGDDISLGKDLNTTKDKIRFFEYGKSFQAEKEGRGFNFEGMLAGLFNGIPIVSKAKEDIIVDGIPYSVKSSEPGSSFDSGTLIYGFRNELQDMEENGVDTTGIKTPYDLLKKEGEEYLRFKIAMLTSMFTSSDGTPIHWIFSIIHPNYIEYTVWTTEELINELVSNPDIIGVGRSPRTDVRMKSRFLMQNPNIIQFPTFTSNELKKLRYDKNRGLKTDKIAELFGKYKTKVRYDVLEYIRKNPQTFLKRVVSLYGDKLGPILKEKGFVELNESIDYNNKKTQNILIDILYEKVCGDQDKHTGEQGDLFTMDGSENLGNTDMFVDDGFDIIHKHGDAYLSDITPEESETAIPKGTKKVKKTVLKPRIDSGPFNISINEIKNKGHYGYVFSDKIPLEIDNKLYVLVNKLGGLNHKDIKKFIENTNRESLHVLQGLLRDFPSSLEELLYYYGSLDSLRNSDEYRRIVSLVKRIGSGERIMEETDVFGQGLLDPIEPEEFEGDEEEWEKMLDDTQEPLEKPEIYTGGKTDAEKGYVAPSKEVTNNICDVEGFCNDQGPITFGQLKALVEEATKKRITGDIGRGVFKSLWRIVPFFIPQILLAAVGVTMTRAFNKIITPALTDTKGYKSWWGKAVLKAMDVAEGDYIPDVALGDDPLSKVFFISDGLMAMIKDKYKLKFARYVANYASTRPDNEPVPEWFVENLLRDYLNQKFLLNPPLPVKIDLETGDKIEMGENQLDLDDKHPERNGQGSGKNKTDSPTFEPPGDDFTKPLEKHRLAKDREFVPEPDEHSKGGIVESAWAEQRLQQTVNNYIDSEYEMGLTEIGRPFFTSVRNGEVLLPGQIIEDINKLFTRDYPEAALTYLRYLESKKEEGFEFPFLVEQREDSDWTSQQDTSFRRLHGDRVNDDKLQIPPATFLSYLNKYHRDKLLKELKGILACIEYNCYDGYKNDPDDENVIDEYCVDCSTEYEDLLGGLDEELIKLGFIKGEGVNETLTKPFPFTYNDWLEGLIKEINPRFYINDIDDLSYAQEIKSINEQKENNLNPDVEVGDVVELIHMDDPWGISPMTKGIVVGFESMGTMGEKILVRWIIKTEEGKEEFRNLPLIKDADYWRIVNPLSQEVNEENQTDLDLERFGNILVRAYFNYSGGWGQPPKRFVVYITPSGLVKGVSLNQGMTNREIPFKEGDKVDLGDLIRFEKNSKFDLQMKGRIRESVIKEQINRYDLTKMTPALWKVLKMVDKLLNGKWYPRSFKEVLSRYFDMKTHTDELYLTLTYNNPDIHELMTTADWEDIKIPNLYEVEIQHYGGEAEETQQDECVDGYAEHTGNPCECSEYEQRYKTSVDEKGEEFEELVDCEDLDEKELMDVFGIDDEDDCPCEEYYDEEYTVYWNPIMEKTILSNRPILEIVGEDSWDNADIGEIENNAHSDYLVTQDDQYDDNFDEATDWNYYDDKSYEIIDASEDYEMDGGDDMRAINQKLYGNPKTITEQEQLKMWPTGQFNFPEGMLDDEEMQYVKDELPDNLVETIFKYWDKKGVDFNILKMLGIDTRGASLLITMLLKRYVQFTTKPLTGIVKWDCDDLANLFNKNNRNFNSGYIEEYLCGKDKFWEPSEWFQYEWDDYMLDSVDENNWKTISSIFGGVSQEVAEHILSEQPQNEEEEELIEKYEDDISEIRHFITWANNDSHEDAVKYAMGADVIDKITDYFEEGNLITTDDGTKEWHIEYDLKDLLVDKWDNTEYFDYTEHDGNTLESIMMDGGVDYTNTQYLGDIILKAYYDMYEVDGRSKVGDELEPETKFWDGYWTPNYDINEILKDRLGEIIYQPEPIQEQSADSPGDNISNDEDNNLDETPLTKLDVSIMNRLAKMFSKDQLREIWEESEENIQSGIYEKFINLTKLFGEEINTREGWAKATRFAKWTDDNWDKAERAKQIELGVTPDTTISDLDFGLVTQPIKEWPSLYNIQGNESYWVKEYRYGEGEFAGYGEDDALEKAEASWFEHDIDMEYGDQGDSDDHELNVSEPSWLKSLKEERVRGLIFETGMLKEMQFDKNEILKLAKNTRGGLSGGRGDVFKYLSHLRDSGLVNMFQAPDFLWSGKEWLTKWLDLNHPDRLEDPDENIQHLLDNADKLRDILIILLMDRADREDRKANLDNLNREIKPLSRDLVKIWSIQLG